MSQNVWFTSDEHYGHKNIIKFCNRPFLDTDEMELALIAEHNRVVSKGDLVYHLGDMFWRTTPVSHAISILDRLNGNHYYILGNHEEIFDEEENYELRNRFVWIKERTRIKPDGGPNAEVVLDHFAGRVWDKSAHGSWQLYGHSHGELPDDPNLLSMDVGVDADRRYAPISLEDVCIHMEYKMRNRAA